MMPLDPLPEPDDEDEFSEDEEDSGITLEALHEELIASTEETRRGNRRVLEVLKNFGGLLDALSATSNDTHKAVRALPAITSATPAAGDGLPQGWALPLVELADRIDRVAHGFTRPPATRLPWWPGVRRQVAAWREAWEMQADAVSILRSHLAATMQRADLERLDVLDRPFDPNTMTAVESTVDPGKSDHTVLAEILPGWRNAASGQLVRPAQVRVSRITAR
ncbi:MAG: GrpE [Verrucomicrobiota bacterium]